MLKAYDTGRDCLKTVGWAEQPPFLAGMLRTAHVARAPPTPEEGLYPEPKPGLPQAGGKTKRKKKKTKKKASKPKRTGAEETHADSSAHDSQPTALGAWSDEDRAHVFGRPRLALFEDDTGDRSPAAPQCHPQQCHSPASSRRDARWHAGRR